MSSPQKVCIIGSGNVGKAMHDALAKTGRDAIIAPRAAQREAVRAGDVIILAIPFAAREEVVKTLGPALDGKIVIDVTNPVNAGVVWAMPEGAASGAEEIQAWAPNARVVKAFNTVFSAFLATGRVGDEQLSVFAAGNDAAAREVVLAMARDLGFDAVDAGELSNARWLEYLLMLEMVLGFRVGHGSQIGFRFVQQQAPNARNR